MSYQHIVASSKSLMVGLLLCELLLSSGVRETRAAESPPAKRWAVVAAEDLREAGLSDLLTAQLSQVPGVELVEREAIRRVLDELKLNSSGLVEPDKAVRFGQLATADALLFVEPIPKLSPPTIRHLYIAYSSGPERTDVAMSLARFDPTSKAFTMVASRHSLEPRNALDGRSSLTIGGVLADTQLGCLWLAIRGGGETGIWKFIPETEQMTQVFDGQAVAAYTSGCVSQREQELLFVGLPVQWRIMDKRKQTVTVLDQYPTFRPWAHSDDPLRVMLYRDVQSWIVAVVIFGIIVGEKTICAEDAAQNTSRRTTVAVTMAVAGDADATERHLADSLLALLELEVSARPALTVVERQQIDLVLDELVFDRSRNADDASRLRLGQLTTADVILAAQLLPPQADRPGRHVLVRVAEARTGRIRGVTVAPVNEVLLDAAAEQIAHYLAALLSAPQHARVTIAVAAFESLGRFDRLRPLETGVREMVTLHLLRLNRFHVLQRSDMQQLLRELELIQSGLADRTQLPETLPDRGAAFFLRGALDERSDSGKLEVRVAGQLVHAASEKSVYDFQFAAAPEKLPKELADQIDRLVARLEQERKLPQGIPRRSAENETQFLFDQVERDLARFRRRCPIDFTYREFPPTGMKPTSGPRRPSRMPALLNQLYSRQGDFEGLSRALEVTARMAEADPQTHCYELAMGAGRLATSLCLHGGDFPRLQRQARDVLMRWRESGKESLAHVGFRTLADIAAAKQDFVAAAQWYQRAAAVCDRSDARDRYARENLLIHAARSLLRAGQADQALETLQSVQPTWARDSLNHGYYGVELGACHAALGQKEKALWTYIHAAEESPQLVHNSDVAKRIDRLGGVPVREDRDIDVRYVSGPAGQLVMCRKLATDGTTLFCGGFYNPRMQGVMALDLREEKWRTITPPSIASRITCLACEAGQLWVGTEADGLWRCDLVANQWTHWTGEHGLPDKRAESVTLRGRTAYVGVGSASAGGLVQIVENDKMKVLDGPGAPDSAATHVVFPHGGMLVRTAAAVHLFDFDSRRWQRLSDAGTPRLYAGTSNIWASELGKELYSFTAAEPHSPLAQPIDDAHSQTENGGAAECLATKSRHRARISVERFAPTMAVGTARAAVSQAGVPRKPGGSPGGTRCVDEAGRRRRSGCRRGRAEVYAQSVQRARAGYASDNDSESGQGQIEACGQEPGVRQLVAGFGKRGGKSAGCARKLGRSVGLHFLRRPAARGRLPPVHRHPGRATVRRRAGHESRPNAAGHRATNPAD
jgi:curli biogenesis system outer membrane secretion channel CsgG